MPDPTTDAPAIDRLTELGAALAKPTDHYLDDAPDILTAVVPAGYSLETLDLGYYDHLRTAPRRLRGQAVVTDTASWLAYFGKYQRPDSEVFGDVQRNTVTAVLNAPGAGDPAWGDHRVVLQLTPSAAWKAWVTHHNQWLSQTAFAEHIEDRTPDLVEPDAASMLELAQTISATTGVRFESSSRLHDGQRRFQYMETVEGKAGQRGQLDIPNQIKIQVQVWRGVAIAVPLTARFRYRIEREGLRLGYVLDRLEDVLDTAWDALLSELRDEIPVPILAGQAPDYAG